MPKKEIHEYILIKNSRTGHETSVKKSTFEDKPESYPHYSQISEKDSTDWVETPLPKATTKKAPKEIPESLEKAMMKEVTKKAKNDLKEANEKGEEKKEK